MRRPLKRCCNGCDKPPKPPSWVLCEDCFAKLDAKMEALVNTYRRLSRRQRLTAAGG